MAYATPDFLTSLPRWVLWREDPDPKTGKPSKRPYQGGNGLPASSTNEKHWSTHDAVHRQAITHPKLWAGTGVVLGVLGTDEVLAGLDLDRCLVDEALSEWAKPYLRLLRTYGETSPSGSGIKLLFRIALADLAAFRQALGLNDREWGRKRTYGAAPDGESHPPAAELYTSGRYFTITGRQWCECPDEVAIVPAVSLQNLAALLGPRPIRTNGSYDGAPLDATAPDNEVLTAKLRHALARQSRLSDRYHGDMTGMQDTSRSSMDMSLGGMLKAAGFSYAEMRALLINWDGGAGGERAATGDERYFERIWTRSAAGMPQSSQAPYEDAGPGQAEEASPNSGRTRNRGAEGAPGEITWGHPVDFLTDPNGQAPELRTEHIPDALFGFVADAAERMGVDPTCVAIAALVACASVVSDNWRLQPKRFDYSWTESPRLWGAIVGAPSILKSPIISACTRPIDHLDAAARARHAKAMRTYKQALKQAKADKSGETPDPLHPKLQRYLVEGATVEAISEVLRDDDEAHQTAPSCKVLSRHDEMGEFFGNLDRYKAGGSGGGDRGAYLRLYNGGVYTVDRIARGSFSIVNWSACFLGGIQPGPIQKIARDAAEDGLLQRFLYAVPGPQKPGVDRAPSAAAQNRYNALFPALSVLLPPRTMDGDQPQVVAMHTDAHQHRESVDLMARAMALMPDTSPRLQAAFGKWPGLFARLALTFHLIEIADANAAGERPPFLLVITEATAKRATAFMLDIVLPHLLRADTLMFSTTQTDHAERIAGFILMHGMTRVTSRDVVRNYKPFASPESRPEMTSVMERLTLVNWLEPEAPTNSMKPVHAWAVNPAVHQRFAGYSERERARRETARETIAAAKEAAANRRSNSSP